MTAMAGAASDAVAVLIIGVGMMFPPKKIGQALYCGLPMSNNLQ
jgi:hypothetical protein